MAALSNYFEKEKSRPKDSVSPYSAPSGATSTAAPSTPAPASSAPTANRGGGSGFVNFGSYFGANAPAIQAQAQKAVEQAKGTAAPTATPGVTATAMPTTMRAGAAGNVAVQGTPKATSGSYESQISNVSKQFEGLNQAAQTGSMGKGTSAFDQMLGGGVTQRAAQAEQQRLGSLRSALEGEKAQADAAAQQAASEQARKDAEKTKDDAYQAWVNRLSPWYRQNYNEGQLRQMFDEQMPAGSYTSRTKDEAYAAWVGKLSPWYRQNYSEDQLRQMFDEQVPPEQYTDKDAPGMASY